MIRERRIVCHQGIDHLEVAGLDRLGEAILARLLGGLCVMPALSRPCNSSTLSDILLRAELCTLCSDQEMGVRP